MKSIKLIFIFLLLFTGCSSDPYNYSRIAHSITNKTILELEKEDKKLMAVGTGGGMMGDIYNMSINFHYFQILNLEESRKLIVHIVKTYLKNINSNTEVRPYLHDYPYPVKKIEVRICLRGPTGKSPPIEEILLISSMNGVLTYKLSEYDQCNFRKILLKETYEEALSILAGNE